MSFVLLTAALLAAAEPAAQSVAKPEPAAAEGLDLKPGERRVKMVCRVETPTGTRFGKRVCMPVNDLARRNKESQEAFGDMQRNVNITYEKGS